MTIPVVRLARQMAAFAGVGVIAAAAHYGALVALVETAGWEPVPATLLGYIAGGVVSYILNRSHTYASERPHREATWRFAVVAGVGFGLTWAFMHLFTDVWRAPYLPAQVLTTGIVLVWSFLAHKLWTFGSAPPATQGGPDDPRHPRRAKRGKGIQGPPARGMDPLPGPSDRRG